MRPPKDQWFLDIARLVAQRSTCIRRSVGCVLVNSLGHIIATGYNGVAAGLPHCNEEALLGDDLRNPFELIASYSNRCRGAESAPGTNLDACEAIHAEQNALLQCHDVQGIDTCYTTTSPCISCVKRLMNTSCQRIVFTDGYPQPGARLLWQKKFPQPDRWVQL